MPQLSLYLTEGNYAALRLRAQAAGVSLSKYVSRLIEDDARRSDWPVGFWGLYGAIDDELVELLDELPSDDARFAAAF